MVWVMGSVKCIFLKPWCLRPFWWSSWIGRSKRKGLTDYAKEGSFGMLCRSLPHVVHSRMAPPLERQVNRCTAYRHLGVQPSRMSYLDEFEADY